MTCDTWHETHGGGWTFSQNFTSPALMVTKSVKYQLTMRRCDWVAGQRLDIYWYILSNWNKKKWVDLRLIMQKQTTKFQVSQYIQCWAKTEEKNKEMEFR